MNYPIYPEINKFDENNYFKIGRLPKPIPDYLYQELFNKGVIPKNKLIKDKYYFGKCRNANVSMWNGDKFIYMRCKFGHWYPEEINHLEDDDGYDLFIPIKEVIPTDYEIIKYKQI